MTSDVNHMQKAKTGSLNIQRFSLVVLTIGLEQIIDVWLINLSIIKNINLCF